MSDMHPSLASDPTHQTHQTHQTHDDGIDILDLVTPLVAHWRSLLAVPLAFGVLTLGASYLIKPTFTATTTLMPPQQSQSSAMAALSSLGALAGLAGGGTGIKSPVDQYVALMQSVSVSDRIVDRFKLLDVYDADYRQEARKILDKNVQITAGKKDGLISVSVDDIDPERAAQMANRYVDELRQMTNELAVSEAQQRRVFFEHQLQTTKDKLTKAQISLQQSGINPGAIKAEPKAAAENYARLQAELTSAEVQLQSLRETLADGSAPMRQQVAVVQSLRGQLQKLAATNRDESSSDYISAYREYKYQETLFELMARQYELARVDESREGALIQVVDPALVPERKSKPKRAIMAIVGTLLSGIFYALWLVIRHRIRRAAAANPVTAERLAQLRRLAG